MYRLIMLPQPILASEKLTIEEANFISHYQDVNGNFFKVIAGLPDLPSLDLSLIAEKIGWVDVEKLAMRFVLDGQEIYTAFNTDSASSAALGGFLRGCKHGFKAAQNEKRYSEEDLFNLLKMIHDRRLDSLCSKTVNNGKVTDFNFWNSDSKKEFYASELINEFIQSLSTPKEYQVEVEMEDYYLNLNEDEVISIQKDMGIYGHDEGLLYDELENYKKNNPRLRHKINKYNTIKVTKIL